MKKLLSALLLVFSFVTVAVAQDQSATNLYRPTATPPAPTCPYSRLFMNMAGQMSLVSCTGVVSTIGGGGGGAGTVTSVAMSLPGIFSVSGSPVTTAGTLTATLTNQTANTIWAGPASGSASAPTFRTLVSNDIPGLDTAKITSGIFVAARLGSGTATINTVLRGDLTWGAAPFPTGVEEVINAVRDYGCVGDDTTINDTCFTNAIAAASLTTGKRIHLRAGTYRTNSKITLPGGVTLFGDGKKKTIIHGMGNDVILDLVAGTGVNLFDGPVVHDLQIKGSLSGSNQIGIRADDPTYYAHALVQDVNVTDTGSHGVFVGKAFSSTFKRVNSGSSLAGYPFLFDGINMPANHFEELYPGDVNTTSPAGFRIRSGNIHCISCNGINVSGSNSWWAIVGDKVGVDGAVGNRSAYFSCHNCNIESSKAGGILHYFNSTSDITGRSEFTGDGGSAGTYIALKYEIDSDGGLLIPTLSPRGNLGPLVVFTNSPLSYYANSEVIHANGQPPVTIESNVRQADGNLISTYRNTSTSRSEKLLRLDDLKPVQTITASANFPEPGATNYEANCGSGCTLTLPWPGYYHGLEQPIFIRNIGAGTLLINANSSGTMNGGGTYSLASGESASFISHSASADYRLMGFGGSGAATRVAVFNDTQKLTGNANFTYDGTTVLNQRAGGNPFFAANDTVNGITTRFGPLAGAPDRAIVGTTSNHPFGIYANNAERWTIGTAGHLTPGAATTYNIGSASLPINNVTIGGSLYWTGSTVRDLAGSGSPEGVVTADIGSIYRRTNGSSGVTLYVKEANNGANTGWTAIAGGGGGGSGIGTLNGLTVTTQSFAVGTSGSDFNINSATSTHTFNLPDAGASARGVVTTGTQTLAGAKTFTSLVTANPGTTPQAAYLADIATLGSAGSRNSNWLVWRGRSNDGSAHLTEWRSYANVTSNAGASRWALGTRIDAGSYTDVFTVEDTGLVSAGDFAGDTFTAGVGFVGDGMALTNLDASQLTVGTVAANRGGAGTITGILQANGSGTVGAVTVSTGLTYSGTTLTVNQGFSPTWTGSHTFTTTTIARELDPQTDNTYALGTTSARWQTGHFAGTGVQVHNDATNTLKALLNFSGSNAQLVTDSATPLQIKTGSNNGLFFNTNGTIGYNLATATSGNVDFRQLANGDTIFNLRRQTDTSPTGNAIRYQTTAGTDLFVVDTTGTMTVGTVPTARFSGTISASNMPALTGDVTTTAGSVATTITNGAVTNAKLANSAITIAGTSTSLGGTITQDTITGLSSTGIVKRTGSNTLAIATPGTDYEVPLTFSTGLTRSTNTITVNSTQNIAKLSNLTSNGFVKTSGGDGTLSVDTNTYLTANQTITLSGDVTGSGSTAITTTVANVPDSALSVNVPLLNGANTFAAGQAITANDGVTNTYTTLLDLQHSSTGPPATNFGTSLRFGLESTTTTNRDAARVNVQWTTATDGSRASNMTFQLVNSATLATKATLSEAGNFTITGAYSGTTFNGIALSGNASTLNVGTAKTATISNSLTLAGTDSTTITFQGTDTYVGRATTDTLTNKTLSASSNVLGGVTMTLGSDATGDGYYRNSGGQLTRLAIGSTSADLMTVSGLPAWKRRVFSILAYGAVCDGSTTNDRAAIQAAIDAAGAAGGGAVSFEGCTSGARIDTGLTIGDGSGTYSTGTATASTYNEITIEGGGSKINWYGSAGSTVFTVNGPIYRIKVRDLFINMKPSTNAAGIAFDLNHPLLSEFSNLYISQNSDYGVRLRAYGGWSGGDGANGNRFDSLTVASTTTGAKGIDIGYTAVCSGCTLDPAQNIFTNFRARFDTGVGTYVTGSIGINLNFTDASQFDNPIIAAATALQVTVPSGTGGDSYPAGILFNNPALTGTASFTVSGTWNAVEGVGFNNYLVGDSQTIPTHAKVYGVTSNGARFNQRGDEGHISGLQLEWVSTTSVKIKTGSAQIESTKEVVTLATDSTISPSLSASAWHYCYLYLNSGTPTVECVTTAPASAWFGSARSKTSNTARRFIGAFRTDGSSLIHNFIDDGAGATIHFRYRIDTATTTRALSNQSATTNTVVSLSNYVPAVSRLAECQTFNLAATGLVVFDTSDAGSAGTGLNPAGGTGVFSIRAGATNNVMMPLNSSQEFRYSYTASPTGSNFLYMDILGFWFDR